MLSGLVHFRAWAICTRAGTQIHFTFNHFHDSSHNWLVY